MKPLNRRMAFVPMLLLCISGCSVAKGNPSSISWISPTGTPTLAFYDQGENENWFSTPQPANFIPASFAANTYDAIVFDGISGLNLLRKQAEGGSDPTYRLARWISQGNFYLVSTIHQNADPIEEETTFDAFVRTGNASKAFLDLALNRWGWGDVSTKTSFEDGVSMVQTNLLSNPTAFDYYLLAEPSLSVAKERLSSKGIDLNVIYDLQEEWSSSRGGAAIPGAGLFIRADSLETKKDSLDAFLEETEHRIEAAVDRPEEAVAALENYSATKGEGACQSRFGFEPALVTKLQANDKNHFGLLEAKKGVAPSSIANAFQTSLGGPEFPSSLFLD